jgi:dihydrodipicolinate synthase/N-acetylneuraminate lyase
MSSFEIHGIVPIIPTPFLESGEIDLDSLGSEIRFAAAAGACAACLPAYASEFYKLTDHERQLVVAEAVKAAAGKIPIVGQANHPYAKNAARLARAVQDAGASAVSVAAPRIFPLTEDDLFRYYETILRAIDVPLVMQDFNPGGPTVGADFLIKLNRAYPHFRYIKLEESLMATKVAGMVAATGGKVGVIEGWGGMYIIELMEAGVSGVMPGLAVADLLVAVQHLMEAGHKNEAYELHHAILPQILYSLQNMELFHHAEKQLLQARGILPRAVVRDATVVPSKQEQRHIQFLNERILALLDRLNMPRNPALAQ